MGSTWRKAKLALGTHLCVYAPRTTDDIPPPGAAAGRSSDAATAPDSPASMTSGDYQVLMPTTPTPTSSGLRISKSISRGSKLLFQIMGLDDGV